MKNVFFEYGMMDDDSAPPASLTCFPYTGYRALGIAPGYPLSSSFRHAFYSVVTIVKNAQRTNARLLNIFSVEVV